MPKVMHINCSCTGSTGKIIGDIADHAVEKGFETLLCAPCAPGTNKNIRYFRTSLPYEQGIYKRLNYAYGFQYGFAPLSTVKIKSIIKKEKPDIIHIHCVNSFMVNVYSLLRFIKKYRIPTVITNHAEFFYTGSCPLAYGCDKWKTGCGNCPQRAVATGGKFVDTSAAAWKKMKASFMGMENAVMVSVSPWVGERAAQSPIVAGLSQEVVKNGVNTEIFTYRNPLELRKKYGFSENTKIVFHPTANFSANEQDRKGGRYFVELAKAYQGQDVVFIVAGRYAQGLELPDNIRLLGLVSDQKMLAEYYAMADITVVTGKRETFNMPVAESLCCGTPVAGFYAGGPESIAMEQYSHFCDQGDVATLSVCLQELLAQKYDKKYISDQAKLRYDAQVMADGYLAIYDRLLTNGSN